MSTDGQENATFGAKNTNPITAISKPDHVIASSCSGGSQDVQEFSEGLEKLVCSVFDQVIVAYELIIGLRRLKNLVLKRFLKNRN